MEKIHALEYYCSICGGPFILPEINEKYQWLKRVKIANRREYDYLIYDKRSIAFYEPNDDDTPNLSKPVLYVITYYECECVHHKCWKLNNESLYGVHETRGDPKMSKYQTEDWFDYDALIKDDNGWMIEDPSKNIKNKKRILAYIKKLNPTGRKSVAQEPSKISKKKTKKVNKTVVNKKKSVNYNKMSNKKLIELIIKNLNDVRSVKQLKPIYKMI